MIVTIIMILTDWLMVGVTKMVYSCKVAYRQGMLFGVHVPGDVVELPEVKTMIEKYQSWMKAFYRWHFAIGTVICFLGMWYMSIFFIAWTVWMTAFFIGVMGKVWQTHRHMYELKMQKGWYEATSEEEQVTSAVDTKTAARTAQMAVPMICHALPLIVLCGPLVIPGLWHAMAVNSESWIIFVCCLLVCGCLLGAALFYDKMGNKIYSEHSPPTVSKGLFSIFLSFLLFCNDDINTSVVLIDRYIIGYKLAVAYSDCKAAVSADKSVVIAFSVAQSVALSVKA